MTNFPALEVVIGLSFVFFIFSLICSAVVEWIATKLNWRARMLEVAMENIFSGCDSITDEGRELAQKFWDHPLIQSLQHPKNEQTLKPRKPTATPLAAQPKKAPARPSYVPSRTFVLALLDLGAQAHVKAATAAGVNPPPSVATVSLEDQINAIENVQMRNALLTLYRSVDGEVQHFRRTAEEWFDDSMQRVTGWYKRHAQRALWLIAILIVLAFNVDTLSIGQTLWRDAPARNLIVHQAETATQTDQSQIDPAAAAKALPVPLGWKLFETGTGPEDIPNTADSIIAKILGLLLSAAALTLGAPFWFDLLSKIVRVRGSGPPPKTSDATTKATAGSTASTAQPGTT